jgi:hypothetical protein
MAVARSSPRTGRAASHFGHFAMMCRTSILLEQSTNQQINQSTN